MRKEFRDTLLVLTAAVTLVSCSTSVAPTRAVENKPQPPVPGLRFSVPDEPVETTTTVSTPTVTRLIPETATPIPTPNETLEPTPRRETDTNASNRSKITESKKGEAIDLSSVRVRYIGKVPYPFAQSGEAFIGTIGQDETEAAMTSANCVFDAYREAGELGVESSVPGFWKPEEPLDSMSATISQSKTVASPVAIINLTKIKLHGKEYDCDEVGAVERLTGYLSKINWKDFPGGVGSVARQIFNDFLDGLLGRKTPVPTTP